MPGENPGGARRRARRVPSDRTTCVRGRTSRPLPRRSRSGLSRPTDSRTCQIGRRADGCSSAYRRDSAGRRLRRRPSFRIAREYRTRTVASLTPRSKATSFCERPVVIRSRICCSRGESDAGLSDGDTRQPAPDVRECLQFGHRHARSTKQRPCPAREGLSGPPLRAAAPVPHNVCSIRRTDCSILGAADGADRESCLASSLLSFASCPTQPRFTPPNLPRSRTSDDGRSGSASIVRSSASPKEGWGSSSAPRTWRDGRAVAIKTARSAREADATAIRREIITLSGLRHPGIVRLHGYGVQSSGPWIALELLEGRTLADELSWYWPETRAYGERRQRTDERPTAPACNLRDRGGEGARRLFPVAGGGHLVEAFSVVQQLSLALDHLHRRGLVHRDVKPANVFLRGDGRTTLFDFGLACSAGATRDRALCVGTMEYAAPEQICGGVVDQRADIYSLGCLLYELVTGRPPFRGDSSSEIAERQMKREPVAPSHLIADVPSRLDNLILSMLEKLPERRPDDAAEIGRGGWVKSPAARSRRPAWRRSTTTPCFRRCAAACGLTSSRREWGVVGGWSPRCLWLSDCLCEGGGTQPAARRPSGGWRARSRGSRRAASWRRRHRCARRRTRRRGRPRRPPAAARSCTARGRSPRSAPCSGRWPARRGPARSRRVGGW